jgi:hypothetical protein
MRRGKRNAYQFAAIIGLPRMFFLLFGFRRTFGMLDLFFFFCNSRPILPVYACVLWKGKNKKSQSRVFEGEILADARER